MIVEDIASQSSVVFHIQHDWRDPISGVHVSPGSAETLVRRGVITNYRSLAYCLSNVYQKLRKSADVRWSILHQCHFLRQCILPFNIRFGTPAWRMKVNSKILRKNWLPWQRSLGNRKKRSRSIIYEQIPIIRWIKSWKLVVDPWFPNNR